MNFLTKLFSGSPKANELSDWFLNLTEVFERLAKEDVSKSNKSADALAYFTLINTTKTASDILRVSSHYSSITGELYSELRAFFECMWQIHFLSLYQSEEDVEKTKILYAMSDMKINGLSEELFRSNKKIKLAIESAFGKKYQKVYLLGISEYIQCKRRYGVTPTDDIFADNAYSLLLNLTHRHPKLTGSENSAIATIITKNREKALNMKLLTDFNFQQAETLPSFMFTR